MVAMYFFVFWSLVYLWKNMTELHLNQSLTKKHTIFKSIIICFCLLVFIGFFVRFVSNFLPDSIYGLSLLSFLDTFCNDYLFSLLLLF